MLTLEANRVNLGRTSVFGVLRGAELKSSVCRVKKMAANASKSNMAATTGLTCIYVHIFCTKQARNSNEMCFCMFSCMGNPMP